MNTESGQAESNCRHTHPMRTHYHYAMPRLSIHLYIAVTPCVSYRNCSGCRYFLQNSCQPLATVPRTVSHTATMLHSE